MTELTELAEAIGLVVADERTEGGDQLLPERECVISARTLERSDLSGIPDETLTAYTRVMDANMSDIDAALLERASAD